MAMVMPRVVVCLLGSRFSMRLEIRDTHYIVYDRVSCDMLLANLTTIIILQV
jgi:hypothetical protein